MKTRSLRDIDYSKSLKEDDRIWLSKVMAGYQDASRKYLSQVTDEATAERLVRKASRDRDARRRDVFVKFFNDSDKFPLLSYEGETSMASPEDAIIAAIDSMRVTQSFTPYGGNAPISVGDKVVVAIEGHSLQNKLASVVSTRRNEFLVEADTNKGRISAYFKANELVKI